MFNRTRVSYLLYCIKTETMQVRPSWMLPRNAVCGQRSIYDARLEALTAVIIYNQMFLDVTPSRQVNSFRIFEGSQCHYLRDKHSKNYYWCVVGENSRTAMSCPSDNLQHSQILCGAWLKTDVHENDSFFRHSVTHPFHLSIMEYPKLRLPQAANVEHYIQSIPAIFPAKFSRAIELSMIRSQLYRTITSKPT
jgi:hypothetical protein